VSPLHSNGPNRKLAPKHRWSSTSADLQPALQFALLIACIAPSGKLAASLCTRCGIPAILGALPVGVRLRAR
jgi:hypothetical protein